MKPNILATSWHPGGINAIIPVIKRLSNDKNVEISVVGHQYSEPILDNNGINYKKINDYGISDISLESIEKLVKQESPALILTGTSFQDEKNKDVIEQNTILAGRKKGIPTIAVLDFWTFYSSRFSDIHSGENLKFLPDIIAIMDEYAQRDLIAEGIGKERLIITGNPHFDNLEEKARRFTGEQKRGIRQKIGADADVLLFYAANAWKKENLGYYDLDNIRLADAALRELPEQQGQRYRIVLKFHPRTPEEDLTEITEYIQKKADKRISIVSGVHPQDIILSCDITLTSYSTLGVEAVCMGKPCISLQPNIKVKDSLEALTKNKIIPVGYNEEDCKALVKRAFADKNYREIELIENLFNFKSDGKATERVTNLVYKTLEKKGA